AGRRSRGGGPGLHGAAEGPPLHRGGVRVLDAGRGPRAREHQIPPCSGELHLATQELDLAVTRQEVVHPGRPGESSGCQVITHPDQEAWMNVHKNARWGSAWMWAGRSTSCTPWPASAVALPRLTGRDRVAFEDQRAAAVTPSQPRA